MTDTESKLASIERLPEGTYRDTKGIGWHGTVVSPSQLDWLIAEVRRLQGENEKLTYYSSAGKMLLDMAESWYQDDGLPRENKLDDAINAWLRMRAARDEAIVDKEREYARGRADERAAVVAWLTENGDLRDCQSIKDGEHAK